MAKSRDARLVPVPDPNGQLTIGDVDLHNGRAWQVLDTSDLWAEGLRGGNILIPGVTEVYVGPMRQTVTEMVFPLVVVGAVDEDGFEVDDAAAGLTANLDQLRQRLLLPPETGVTRLASWARPDGSTWTAEVKTVDVAITLRDHNVADWIATVERVSPWNAGS